jgi:LysM domain
LFTRLERYAYAPVAALVLWAVLLMAAWPAVADAQETPRANDPQGSDRDARAAGYVVVASGDSLWSISERQLGPGATPSRIARGAERIYALNRDHIGTDPNTILVGQKLALPSAVERRTPRQVPEPAGAEPARGTAAAAKVAPRGRDAKSGPDRVRGQTAGEPTGEPSDRGAKASEAAAQRRSLPDGVAVAPVPVVGSLAAGSNPRSPVAYLSGTRAMILSAASALVEFAGVEDRYAGRQLLGGALILMSLGGAFPIASAMLRAARRARVRREYDKSFYRSAGIAYAAAPLGGSGNAHAEGKGSEGPRSAAPEERERPPDSANSGNRSGALEEARGGARVAQIANSNRARLRRAGRRGSTRRRPPRGTKVSGARQVQARGSKCQSVNRRKMVGDNPKTPDARRGWGISESLRCSLEGLPLQPGAPMDQTLAELMPQLVDELRSVAVLKRRRQLSDLEHRQASALQDLIALAQEENPNDKRRV